jgi:hypothetical protein
LQPEATIGKDKRWSTLLVGLNSFVGYDLCQPDGSHVKHNFSPLTIKMSQQSAAGNPAQPGDELFHGSLTSDLIVAGARYQGVTAGV